MYQVHTISVGAVERHSWKVKVKENGVREV